MTIQLFEETINGSTFTQMHDAAMDFLIRVYNPEGSVHVSKDDMDAMAWDAVSTVYEKKERYIKQGKDACGLACTIAHNALMTHLKQSMKRNMENIPMDVINTEKGVYNAEDVETGKKITTRGIGVGREFDITFGEGIEIIESEIDKLSFVEKQISEMILDLVPQKDIAKALNMSYSNVRKKLFDIRKKLMKNNYILGKLCEMGLAS